jgi:hypothetical protein
MGDEAPSGQRRATHNALFNNIFPPKPNCNLAVFGID